MGGNTQHLISPPINRGDLTVAILAIIHSHNYVGAFFWLLTSTDYIQYSSQYLFILAITTAIISQD